MHAGRTLAMLTLSIPLADAMQPAASSRPISVADFGAVPDEGISDAAALRKAMDY